MTSCKPQNFHVLLMFCFFSGKMFRTLRLWVSKLKMYGTFAKLCKASICWHYILRGNLKKKLMLVSNNTWNFHRVGPHANGGVPCGGRMLLVLLGHRWGYRWLWSAGTTHSSRASSKVGPVKSKGGKDIAWQLAPQVANGKLKKFGHVGLAKWIFSIW